MKFSSPFLFSLIVFLSAISLQAQRRSPEEQAIAESCSNYIALSDSMYGSADFDPAPLALECTPTTFKLVRLNAEFIHLMGYSAEHQVSKVGEVKLTGQSATCIVELEESEPFELNLEEVEGKWLVNGYNGHLFSEEELEKMEAVVQRKRMDVQAVDSLIPQFVRAWNRLRENGDSSLLVPLLSHEFLALMVWDQKIDQLKGRHNPRPIKLERIIDVHWRSDTSAQCQFQLSQHRPLFYLRKRQDKWIIVGEDEKPVDWEMVNRKKAKVLELQEKKTVVKGLSDFSHGLTAYFAEGDEQGAKESATEEVQAFLEAFKKKVGDYELSYLKIHGIHSIDYYNIELFPDSAVCKTRELNLILLRKGGVWKVAGLDGQTQDLSHPAFVEDQWGPFKEAFRFDYDFENQPGLEEVVFVDAVASESSEEAKPSPPISPWHILVSPPSFPGGGEALYDWLDSKGIERYRNGERNLHIAFIVEKDGSLSEIELEEGLGDDATKAITELFAQMPPWNPASKYSGKVRMRWRISLFEGF